MKGGAPRAVWCTSENDPHVVSARSVAQTLDGQGKPVHVVWNPVRGELVQLLPVTRAGSLIGPEIGREGRVCVQIMVVGAARLPFTHGHLKDLETVMAWLDSWGVAHRWPSGPPLDVPQAYQASQDRKQWSRGGHFGQSQVPGSTTPGPGGIDIRKLTGPETPLAEIPRPRASSESNGVASRILTHL
ncbi:hypothetical protein [Actinocorallia longicatena]|uniref:Uncharacterized protein n=1 Tax=Actinocorallia longicatena TaxID=111803 RepID=A0ABP6QL57_9ACTN